MKKALKIVVGIVVVLLILLLGAVLSLPITIGPLVTKGVAAGAPKVLGVEASVGDVKLKPLAGRLILSDLRIGNPKGYSDKAAFAVKTVDIDLKTLTILKGDVLHIEKILIDSPAISYEIKDGVSNFDTMIANAQTAEETEDSKATKDAPDKKPKKKIIIDEFVLNGSKVSYASKITFGKPVTIPLPSLTLHDIGKASGGASMIEALNEVSVAIIVGLKNAIAKLAGKSVDVLKGTGGAAVDAAGDAAHAAEDAVKGATKKLKGLFGK